MKHKSLANYAFIQDVVCRTLTNNLHRLENLIKKSSLREKPKVRARVA
jgi:hypothetical protein